MKRLVGVCASALVASMVGGCFAPDYKSGNLRCADGDPACPTGFYCAAVTHTCWKDGSQPPPFGAFWTSCGGGSGTSESGARLDVTVGGKPYGYFSDHTHP